MKKFFADFKAFITRGNVLDLAVGVIIGGAFNAIVNALAAILLSLATWRVPGGIKGLVTVLPAANKVQKGVSNIGQKFCVDDLQAMTFQFAKNQNALTFGKAFDGEGNEITGEIVKNASSYEVTDAAGYAAMQNALLGKYTLHGKKFTYNMSAIIDWGTLINAIISFLIIALTLFIIIKVAAAMARKRDAARAKIEEEKYKKWAAAHPEEAAELEAKKAKEAEEAGKPVVDPVVALLEEIRDTLKKDEPEEAKSSEATAAAE